MESPGAHRLSSPHALSHASVSPAAPQWSPAQGTWLLARIQCQPLSSQLPQAPPTVRSDSLLHAALLSCYQGQGSGALRSTTSILLARTTNPAPLAMTVRLGQQPPALGTHPCSVSPLRLCHHNAPPPAVSSKAVPSWLPTPQPFS